MPAGSNMTNVTAINSHICHVTSKKISIVLSWKYVLVTNTKY